MVTSARDSDASETDSDTDSQLQPASSLAEYKRHHSHDPHEVKQNETRSDGATARQLQAPATLPPVSAASIPNWREGEARGPLPLTARR